MAEPTVQITIKGKDAVSGVFKGIASAARSSFQVVGTAVAAGMAGVGAAFAGATLAGLRYNSTLEQTRARMAAFLGDGEAVADVMEMIRDRAAKTPFAFEEMASATASLIPAAKMSGEELEGLIEIAEVLAASNPLEGLEGASFSLREAISGDFTSIIERFNLSRVRLKELKAEGVPALDAIRIHMEELGLSTDLVTGLAETFTGRWSTLKDTLLGFAQVFTSRLFDSGKGALEDLQGLLEANTDKITAFAESLGTRLAGAFDWLVTTALPRVIGGLQSFGQLFGDSIKSLQEGLAGTWEDDPEKILPLHRIFGNLGTALGEFQRGMDSGAGEGLLKRLFLGGMEVADDFLPQEWLTRIYNFRDAIGAIQSKLAEGDIAGALAVLIPAGWAETLAPAVAALGNLDDKLLLAKFLIGEGEWITALALFIPPEWAERVGEAATKLGELATKVGDFIAENPQQLVDFAVDLGIAFVGWQILSTVIPLLATASGLIAGMLSPVGLLALGALLLGAAWATNWGSIREDTEKVIAAIQPLIDTLIKDMDEEMPSAVASTQEAFKNLDLGDPIENLGELASSLATLLETLYKVQAWFEWASGFDFTNIWGAITGAAEKSIDISKGAGGGSGGGGTGYGGDGPISPTPPTPSSGPPSGEPSTPFAGQTVNITIQDSRNPDETAYKVMDIIQAAAI